MRCEEFLKGLHHQRIHPIHPRLVYYPCDEFLEGLHPSMIHRIRCTTIYSAFDGVLKGLHAPTIIRIHFKMGLRVGRLLAFVHDSPLSINGLKTPRGWGMGGGGALEGGFREGRWQEGSGGSVGGGVHVGRFGVVVGEGGWAEAPVTSPCPPSRVRARARVEARLRVTVRVRVRVSVTGLVEQVLVL